jgi:thymidylate kinase
MKVFQRRSGLIVPLWATAGEEAHYQKPAHGNVISLVKLFILFVEWLLTYWIQIRPLVRQGCLVIYDRHYFVDLQIDPLRYRYGGPMWAAELANRWLPQSNALILLNAPEEVLSARKQEIPRQILVALRRGYCDLVQRLDNAYIIDASRPLDWVVNQVLELVNHI